MHSRFGQGLERSVAGILVKLSRLVGKFGDGVFDDSAAVTEELTNIRMVLLVRRIVELDCSG